MIMPRPDAGTPVLKAPMRPDKLVGLLEGVLAQLYPLEARKQASGDRGEDNAHTKGLRQAQVRYNAFRSSISHFSQFLTQNGQAEVVVEERLIQTFEAHLSAAGVPRSYLGNHRNQIRKLINLLPSDMRQREIVSLVNLKQAHRWDAYSQETQELLNRFLVNGRKIKRRSYRQQLELSNSMLSKPYRAHVVETARTFLKAIKATDILKVTASDVNGFIALYEEDDRRQTAVSMLDYIRPLFNNLLLWGKITADPLADVPRKVTRENHDYVPQEGIDKLADLSTVDMADFMSVRDRLLCFSLYYDFALRNREGSLLKVSDLKLNGHTMILLPKEIQKVQREDSLLFSYFRSVTRPLIERYLELRNRKNPCTDILIISEDGEPLQADGCRGAVKAHCERLGVKTYDGQIPTPHRLRHSFGTLNAERIGIGLSVKQIKNQLRHTSTEITEKIYIAQNTVLKTLDYEATMRQVDAAGEQNPNATGNLSTPSSSHSQAATHIASKSTDKVIPEVEAIRMIHKLGVNYKTLRQYCLEANKASQNGRGYDYSHPFIADLASNHMTAQEAMDLLKMSKSAFFRWRNSEGIDCIQIGQVGLYRQDQILQKKRAG